MNLAVHSWECNVLHLSKTCSLENCDRIVSRSGVVFDLNLVVIAQLLTRLLQLWINRSIRLRSWRIIELVDLVFVAEGFTWAQDLTSVRLTGLCVVLCVLIWSLLNRRAWFLLIEVFHGFHVYCFMHAFGDISCWLFLHHHYWLFRNFRFKRLWCSDVFYHLLLGVYCCLGLNWFPRLSFKFRFGRILIHTAFDDLFQLCVFNFYSHLIDWIVQSDFRDLLLKPSPKSRCHLCFGIILLYFSLTERPFVWHWFVLEAGGEPSTRDWALSAQWLSMYRRLIAFTVVSFTVIIFICQSYRLL